MSSRFNIRGGRRPVPKQNSKAKQIPFEHDRQKGEGKGKAAALSAMASYRFRSLRIASSWSVQTFSVFRIAGRCQEKVFGAILAVLSFEGSGRGY